MLMSCQRWVALSSFLHLHSFWSSKQLGTKLSWASWRPPNTHSLFSMLTWKSGQACCQTDEKHDLPQEEKQCEVHPQPSLLTSFVEVLIIVPGSGQPKQRRGKIPILLMQKLIFLYFSFHSSPSRLFSRVYRLQCSVLDWRKEIISMGKCTSYCTANSRQFFLNFSS